MVRFPPIDLKRPVDLLHEEQTHHLVGKGHAGEGQPQMGGFLQGERDAEGAADDEGDVAYVLGDLC